MGNSGYVSSVRSHIMSYYTLFVHYINSPQRSFARLAQHAAAGHARRVSVELDIPNPFPSRGTRHMPQQR